MVALIAAALIVVPQGFYEAKVLEPAASWAAGKPVAVYCAATDLQLREYTKNVYGGPLGQEVGLALIDESSAMLGQSACWPLRAQLAGKHPDTATLASSILTLTHEAIHLRGIRDEGQTECTAIHTMPGVAVRFFHVKAGKQLRALMSDAWGAHRGLPASYQAVC